MGEEGSRPPGEEGNNGKTGLIFGELGEIGEGLLPEDLKNGIGLILICGFLGEIAGL